MLGTVHMLSGAAIGKMIGAPELTIPLAFLSHFILDAIPHYDTPGITDYNEHGITKKNIGELLVKGSEPVFGIILTIILAYQNPNLFLPILLGAFFAVFPDILEFLMREFRLNKAIKFLERFHNNSKNNFLGAAIQIVICIISTTIVLL